MHSQNSLKVGETQPLGYTHSGQLRARVTICNRNETMFSFSGNSSSSFKYGHSGQQTFALLICMKWNLDYNPIPLKWGWKLHRKLYIWSPGTSITFMTTSSLKRMVCRETPHLPDRSVPIQVIIVYYLLFIPTPNYLSDCMRTFQNTCSAYGIFWNVCYKTYNGAVLLYGTRKRD